MTKIVDEDWYPYYTYRDFPIGWYKNPTIDNISKVFPSEYREFDNNIWLWTNNCTWYMSEECLEEYIKLWLSWDNARDYYEKELEEYSKKET
jgi:hypothetical protein